MTMDPRIPDLGALGKPQQIAMTPAVIPLRAEGVNAQGFADVVTIVAMIRETAREDAPWLIDQIVERLQPVIAGIVHDKLRELLSEPEPTRA